MANMQATKTPMPEQDPNVRNKNFKEVTLGYTAEMAINEAKRCLQCKKPHCVEGCPVNIHIPEFIHEVAEGNFEKAYEIITDTNSLPALSGRVCPQETQCESKCVRGNKGEPVAIGRLERFVADWYRENVNAMPKKAESNGLKVAVVGSGPSGLTCASLLAKKGYQVSLFEALHTAGGVLVYGIPEFRLPKAIVANEVEKLKAQGVEVMTDMVIGKVLSIDDLFEMGFKAVFVGSGAEYLYGLIVQLLGAARIYAAEDPSYEKIALVYRAHGASLELLPLGADGIRSDALAAARASVLHITPYRSYPSNVTASAAKRREYIRWASEPGRYIVEDDFSSEFTVASKPEETVFSLAESGNVIYLNTFSQTVAPSLRMGYMVLSEKLAAQYAERIGFYSCTVPLFEQLVLAELLESGDYERHIRRTRRALRKRTEK